MTHTLGNTARRIAVVQMPRAAGRRLGWIRNAQPFFSLVTLTDEQPSNAATWLASKVTEQAIQRDQTPGTLTYTLQPAAAPPVIARWNSWNGPCGSAPIGQPNGPASAPPLTLAPPASAGPSPLFLVAAGLGAVASAAYLFSRTGRK